MARTSTLSSRLSATFFLLALGQTAVLLLMFFAMLKTVDRQISGDTSLLAKGLATDIQPESSPVFNELHVRRRIHQFLNYNPQMNVFIVDAGGTLLLDYCYEYCPKKQWSVDPIVLAAGSTDSAARIIDPISGTPVAFSVAHFEIRGVQHYLLVTLSKARSERIVGVLFGTAAWQVVTVTAILFAMVSSLLALLLFRRTSHRFSTIMNAVRAYRSGAFETAITDSRTDELADLANALNEMAITISQSVSELEARDRLRRELIENVWHDLKGPVSGIHSLTEILDRNPGLPPEERTRLVSGVSANVALLKRFLEDLRELARLETKEIQPILARGSLELLVDELLLAHQHSAQTRGVTLTVSIDDNLPAATFDERLILRAMTNLVENAIRHTNQGGTVDISLRLVAQTIEVAVSDTGMGIATAELPLIFKRSYQSADQVRVGSSGLGLAIVERIIQGHGTTIRVESGEGTGTCFSFRLPVAA